MAIQELQHPEYAASLSNWQKYRDVFEGGFSFISNYVEKLSSRESEADYEDRISITYCPAHAKAAVVDIRNSIYQRMIDIKRMGGTASYQLALSGKGGGVDLKGSTMNGYIGCVVLDELLSIGKVGICIDRAALEGGITKDVASKNPPYLYMYTAEQIKSWSYDSTNRLVALLLEQNVPVIDEETGLTTETALQYRLYQLQEGSVTVTTFDDEGNQLESASLALTRIPFVIFEISQSLLTDVASYQIALLNLASSDMSYAIKSNYPFYVEQYNPMAEMAHLQQMEVSGDAIEATDNKDVKVGVAQGRRYPKGLERPGFIHPSAEPLKASMEKQQTLKEEVRQLVNLSLLNLQPSSSSAESKEMSNQGLEAGLSYIGLELQHGESQIAEIWAEYEGTTFDGLITYPEKYSLRSDEDRRDEAKGLLELSPKVPSQTFQKQIAKQVVRILLDFKVDQATLDTMINEIETAPTMVTDPDLIIKDHQEGLVSDETASMIRGYPQGEIEQARKDHADRAARIALAQSQASTRGVADMDNKDSNAGPAEKDQSRDTTLDEQVTDKTRGEAQ